MILENAELLDIFILMSILNFMLKHGKSFITSGPDFIMLKASIYGSKCQLL